MMTNKIKTFAFTAALIGGLGACSGTVEAPIEDASLDTAKPDVLPYPSTIKPGAAVDFEFTVTGGKAAGENGAASISIGEVYESGTLRVVATGSDGLEVFGAQRSAEFDLAEGPFHTWPVSFRAEADGVYYLKVMATVDAPGASGLSRASGVRIEVGDNPVLAQKANQGRTQQLEDGRMAIIMDAEETISE